MAEINLTNMFANWLNQWLQNNNNTGGNNTGGNNNNNADGTQTPPVNPVEGTSKNQPTFENFINWFQNYSKANPQLNQGDYSTADQLNQNNIYNPTLPPGTAFQPAMQTPQEGELLDSSQYQIDPTAYQQTAQQGTAQQAGQITPEDAATYDASEVDENANQVTAEQGQVSEEAQVEAAQGQVNPAIMDLLSGYTSWDEELDPRATVQKQYEMLTDFDPNNPPAWAKGAIRKAQQAMAARGLGSSTMMGEAVTGAVLQAALPIAQQDANIFAAIHMKKMDQKQQATLLQAGYLAEMDMANLNNRQQAAVINAQHFMSMDMANLNNRQQATLINSQNRQQAMLSNQAAINAAAQFNAQSENQVKQFYDNLAATISMFNTTQANAMAQFNAGEANAMAQFNAQMASQRDSFNIQNAIQIDQANAQWLRDINTANTAVINQANLINAQKLFDISATAMANELQKSRDIMNYAFTAYQNQLTRAHNLAIAQMQSDMYESQLDAQESRGFWSALGGVAGSIFNNWDSIFG